LRVSDFLSQGKREDAALGLLEGFVWCSRDFIYEERVALPISAAKDARYALFESYLKVTANESCEGCRGWPLRVEGMAPASYNRGSRVRPIFSFKCSVNGLCSHCGDSIRSVVCSSFVNIKSIF